MSNDTPLVFLLFGSIFFIFGIIQLNRVRLALRDSRLIRAATEGTMLRDGNVSAAIGTIHALRDPIEAPFSRRRCAIFEYQMYQTVEMFYGTDPTLHERKDIMCMGIRMVPCAVRTDKGDVRLVGGYSELHGFSSRSFDDDKAYVAAKEFASKTSFQKAKRVKRKIPAPIDDDVGIIELHQRSADVDPTGQVLEETCVLIGEPVCAIGHYSRMKNAFIQNGWSTVIYRGRPDTALSEATTHTLIYRVLAVVFLGVGTVGIWVGLSKWT